MRAKLKEMLLKAIELQSNTRGLKVPLIEQEISDSLDMLLLNIDAEVELAADEYIVYNYERGDK